MKISKVILIMLLASLMSCSFAESNQHPVIKKDQGIIVLPPKMKKAIKAFNPDFKMWKMEDYTPTILKEDHQKDSPQKLPFALIVDANEDNIPDVILDGHDKEKSLLIGVISHNNGYRVLTVEEKKLVSPKTIQNMFEGNKEYGLSYFLWTLQGKKKTKETNEVFMIGYPQQTTADGTLLNDGAFLVYRYLNKKFYVEYLTL